MNETELERLVVRMVGDVSSYIKALEQARQATQEEAARIKAEQDRIAQSFSNVAQTVATSLMAIGVSKFWKDTLHEWEQAEKAVINLEAAIAANGREVASVSADYQEWATEMQRTTTLSDEQAMALVKMSETFDLSGGAAKKAAKDAMALAAVNDSSAQSMIRLTAAMEKGDVATAMMFARMVPQLRGVRDETEFVDKYNRLVAAGMEVTAKEAATLGGQLTMLGNQWSDVQEELGETAAKGLLPVVRGGGELLKWVQALPPEVKTTAAVVLTLAASFTAVAVAGPLAARGIASVAASTKTLAVSMATNPMNLWVVGITAATVAVVAFKDDIFRTKEEIDKLNASLERSAAHWGTTGRIISERASDFMSGLGGMDRADKMRALEAERERLKKEIEANEATLARTAPGRLESLVGALGMSGPEGRAAAADRAGLISETDAYRRALEGVSAEIDRTSRRSSTGSFMGTLIPGITTAIAEMKKLEDASKAATEAFYADLGADAAALIERLKTPAEKMAEEKDRIEAMFASGFIDQDTYERALTDLEKQLLKTADAQAALNREVDAAAFGTSDAYRRIMDAQRAMYGDKTPNNGPAGLGGAAPPGGMAPGMANIINLLGKIATAATTGAPIGVVRAGP